MTWPRTILCCYAPGCKYAQAYTVAAFQTCPAHGTPLSPVAVVPAQPKDFQQSQGGT